MSSSTSAFGQSSSSSSIPDSSFSGSALTNGVMSMGACKAPGFPSPFPIKHTPTPQRNIFSTPLPGDGCCRATARWSSTDTFSSLINGRETVSPFSSADRSKTDASAGKESKQEHKLQCDEIEKSVQRHQEDMKSWIERYRYLELEKIKDTKTINQLREELAKLTKSKDVIIAEYLESPAFTKRLDEEHEKRLSELFHPCYVKALCAVQTKLPDTIQTKSPDTMQTKLPESFNSVLHGTSH